MGKAIIWAVPWHESSGSMNEVTFAKKNNLRMFAVGFSIASILIGMMLFINQWEITTLVVKIIYIMIVVAAILLGCKLTFREYIEPNHTKETT